MEPAVMAPDHDRMLVSMMVLVPLLALVLALACNLLSALPAH